MGHFSDFSQKFSLLPSAENTDVNLSVAWWGKWPAVYHGAAQNGFWNLPSHLKIDPGYFGEGFYLTRYPRYSDYYISGSSLSKRKVDNGSIPVWIRDSCKAAVVKRLTILPRRQRYCCNILNFHLTSLTQNRGWLLAGKLA